MLINAGIRQVIYLDGYPDTLSMDMLHDAGITVTAFSAHCPLPAGGQS
jgi:dCMP deaminase